MFYFITNTLTSSNSIKELPVYITSQSDQKVEHQISLL